MRVDPKALVRRLDPACTEALEEAVSSAAASRCYEIVVEHVLHALLDQPDGDVADLLGHLHRDRLRARASVATTLQRLRTGNAGRPVFADSVFQWFEEAFAARGNRYTAESIPELAGLPLDDLRRLIGRLAEPEPAPAAPVTRATAQGTGSLASAPSGATPPPPTQDADGQRGFRQTPPANAAEYPIL